MLEVWLVIHFIGKYKSPIVLISENNPLSHRLQRIRFTDSMIECPSMMHISDQIFVFCLNNIQLPIFIR